MIGEIAQQKVDDGMIDWRDWKTMGSGATLQSGLALPFIFFSVAAHPKLRKIVMCVIDCAVSRILITKCSREE
jgi:hypothetical protein